MALTDDGCEKLHRGCCAYQVTDGAYIPRDKINRTPHHPALDNILIG